jgi:hypothetical protein
MLQVYLPKNNKRRLIMKSKVIELFDYRQIPIPEIVYLEGVNEAIDIEVRHLLKKYKYTCAVDVIEAGDIVSLNLTSPESRYNKSGICLNVGKLLFDKELENQLPGLRVGQATTLVIEGKPVNVQVISARRTVYPPLTDEIVSKEMISIKEPRSDIKTVEQYMDMLHGNILRSLEKEKRKELLQKAVTYVINHSTWQFDFNEEQELFKFAMSMLNKQLAEDGMDMDTMSDEDYRIRYSSIEGKKQLEENTRNILHSSIAARIASCCLEGKDPALFTYEEINESIWDILEEHLKDRITFKEKEDC